MSARADNRECLVALARAVLLGLTNFSAHLDGKSKKMRQTSGGTSQQRLPHKLVSRVATSPARHQWGDREQERRFGRNAAPGNDSKRHTAPKNVTNCYGLGTLRQSLGSKF